MPRMGPAFRDGMSHICISGTQTVRISLWSNPPALPSKFQNHMGLRMSNLACARRLVRGGRPEGPLYFELVLKMTMNRTGLISRKYAAALAVALLSVPFAAIERAEAGCTADGSPSTFASGKTVVCSGNTLNTGPDGATG